MSGWSKLCSLPPKHFAAPSSYTVSLDAIVSDHLQQESVARSGSARAAIAPAIGKTRHFEYAPFDLFDFYLVSTFI